MATKRYISKTGVKYSFLVEVNGKIKSISFKGNEKDCIVTDPATQKKVESSKFFKNGWIGVAPGSTAGGFDEEVNGLAGGELTGGKLKAARANPKDKVEQGGMTVDVEPASYPEVTDINSAVEVLRGEPYNIAHQSLRTPEAIFKKAEEVGASFPNLPKE